MKYRVTKKHPELKEGIELKTHPYNAELVQTNKDTTFTIYQVNDWTVKGWCKEIQEPKWTDDQMKEKCISFANKVIRLYGYKNDKMEYNYKHWLKEENNKTI